MDLLHEIEEIENELRNLEESRLKSQKISQIS